MKSEHVLQRYLTPTALRIRKSPIRLIMQRAAKIEGKVTKFGGGQPQSKLFPIDDNAQIRVPISTFDGGTKIVSAKIDTTMALNYNGRTYNKGLPGLSKWIFNHMDKFHPRSKSSFDCCITSGSTDALNKCIVMLSEPGDVILACEFTYTGILVNPKAQGRVIESVAMDHNGMLPKSLDETCRKIRASGKRVRLVYVPSYLRMHIYILSICRDNDDNSLTCKKKKQISHSDWSESNWNNDASDSTKRNFRYLQQT